MIDPHRPPGTPESECRPFRLRRTSRYRFSEGMPPFLISAGVFAHPALSADGKWLVVSHAKKNWAAPNGVMFFNMEVNAGLDIGLPPADDCHAICFFPENKKFLLYRRNEAM